MSGSGGSTGPSTTERELLDNVDLALADGRRLNPEAKGWSRRPVQRANLRGVWGRTKRWDYWGILAGDLLLSATYADIDYLGLADIFWHDLSDDTGGGRGVIVPLGRGMSLPERCGTVPLHLDRPKLSMDISDDLAGTTRIEARWTEADGSPGSLRAEVLLPDGHESLNVVIPWTERRYQFTSKQQARPASGELEVGGRSWSFGHDVDAGRAEAYGVLDVGRGRWPYSTRWNWGGGAGRSSEGRSVGIQIGGKWTEGTGFTENGVIIDGRLVKLGNELEWDYSWDEPLAPWTVKDPGGWLDLVLEPRFDKHSATKAGLISTETHQVFGRWSGSIRDDDGFEHVLHGIQGFAEESRSRW